MTEPALGDEHDVERDDCNGSHGNEERLKAMGSDI